MIERSVISPTAQTQKDMMSLLQFHDGFFDDLCYGVNDADVVQVFSDALESSRAKIERAVRSRAKQSPAWEDMADKLSVGMTAGNVVVNYPAALAEDIDALEYGRPDVPMQPVIRPAINAVASEVIKEIERRVAT